MNVFFYFQTLKRLDFIKEYIHLALSHPYPKFITLSNNGVISN